MRAAFGRPVVVRGPRALARRLRARAGALSGRAPRASPRRRRSWPDHGQRSTRRAERARTQAPAPQSRPARGTAAQAPAAGRDACARTLCAAALGADGLRGGARPGRPPSRPRSRPRATGTSGPRVRHRARAAQAWIAERLGTCVRKLGAASDGSATNVCTHRRPVREMALQSGLAGAPAATEVARAGVRRRAAETRCRRRQGPGQAARTPVRRWLLRLPGVRPAGRVGPR